MLELAAFAEHSSALLLQRSPTKESIMKYGVAWLLGVPTIVIAGWFLLNHC
jgi:hypothetical protein